MFIQRTTVSVIYKKIEGIKKVYSQNESFLKQYFNEALVLPVPDIAPVEIPRIIVTTLNDHGKLTISPIATTFEVSYDKGFEKDWNVCSEYISDRMEKIFEFLNKLTNNKYEYIGLISNVIYDEVKVDGCEKIVKNLLNAKNIPNIYDINLKYTFVENDNLFDNIMLHNYRNFNKDISLDLVAGALNSKFQVGESIEAIIDINDRYGFNNCSEYESNDTKFKFLIDCMGNVINNKISSLIENAIY